MNKIVMKIVKKFLFEGFCLMVIVKVMMEIYEENFKFVFKYVYVIFWGYEVIQLAIGMQLLLQDYVVFYYWDDVLFLGIGLQFYDLMLQLMVKWDDLFFGGWMYYFYFSLKDEDKLKILYQFLVIGMQVILIIGVAMGIQYKEQQGLVEDFGGKNFVVVCFLGDVFVIEGEVVEVL